MKHDHPSVCEVLPDQIVRPAGLVTGNENGLVTPPGVFVVDDEFKVNWVVRKIVQARESSRRTRQWCAEELARSNNDERRLLHLYGTALERWTAAELAKQNRGRKSISVPAGRLGFHKAGLRLIVLDEDAVLAWARHRCPTAIQTVEKLVRSALHEHFVATGEVPPVGVRIEPERDYFFIR